MSSSASASGHLSGLLRSNRLAARIGSLSGLGFALLLGLFGLFGLLPGWSIFLSVPAALITYGTVYFLVARRVDLARQTLRSARKGRFEALEPIQEARRRDELDGLLWQVYRAGKTLQQEIERLQELENYRREYIGDVSHELKTPIFAISGFAESLLDGALEDERVNRTFLQKIARNALRLDALARDLTDLSRIETGELEMSIEPFALQPLAMDVAEALEVRAASREVRLYIQVSTALPLVYGDRKQLRHVLANLVENAIKYNNVGGRVEMTARLLSDGLVRIAVVDDGLGIPSEAIPRLTERFFRVDKSRSRDQGGTGLGLAIVKHILEAHDQKLSISSKVGYGSTFSFLLRTSMAPPPSL